MTYNTVLMDTNTLEVEPNYFNPQNEDIHYNPSDTTIYKSNDLDYVSNFLDNLSIIYNFCTICSKDEYIEFYEKHLE